jgi:hypothetical protein
MAENRRDFLKELGLLGVMAAMGELSLRAADKPEGMQSSRIPQFQIDHVTAAGRSLRQMQDSLASFGLKTENGGPHSNHATEMALLSFPDGSYLELIGLQQNPDPKAVAAHYWSRFLQADAGPCAWAVQVPDVSAEAQRFSSLGIAVTTPAKNGRTRMDGVQLDWDFARVGPGPNGTFFPFLIRDLTPRGDRVYPSGKPTMTTYRGISKVVIAVKDMESSVQLYQRAYNLPAPTTQDDSDFGAKLAWFKGTPVILATPSSDKSPLAGRIAQFGDAPCAFILAAAETHKTTALPLRSKWFGKQISWFDPAKLGWRLGVE